MKSKKFYYTLINSAFYSLSVGPTADGILNASHAEIRQHLNDLLFRKNEKINTILLCLKKLFDLTVTLSFIVGLVS